MNPGRIDDSFGEGVSEKQLAGVSYQFASTIPGRLHTGLENVGGKLTADGNRTLSPNSSVTLLLDLRTHGGFAGNYRFTFVEKKAGGLVLVEYLGGVGIEGLGEQKVLDAEKRFSAMGFTRKGFNHAESEVLLRAVMLVPDAVLSTVSGIRFKREISHPTRPTVAADYGVDDHTINVFDGAFDGAPIRSVAAGGEISDESVRTIVHELGHAIDLIPLRKASVESERTKSDAPMKRSGTSASGGRWVAPKSGGEWDVSYGTSAGKKSEFRTAALKDSSARLTEYADEGWDEFFAESFSYYITNPGLLQRLRPSTHAYFVKHYS